MKRIVLLNMILYSSAAGIWLSGAMVAFLRGNYGLCLVDAALTVCHVCIAYSQGAPHVQPQRGREHPAE